MAPDFKETTEKTPAEVIVIGDGNTYLALYVYDRHGNCVAHDEGTDRIRDDLAAGWVSADGQTYAFEMVNLGRSENQVNYKVRGLAHKVMQDRSPTKMIRRQAFPPKRVNGNEERKLEPKEFQGGQRVCIIFEGDHDPVEDLIVTVLDAKGRVVAREDRGGDLGAVIWYPPEDGKYTIVVKNTGKTWNDVTLIDKMGN